MVAPSLSFPEAVLMTIATIRRNASSNLMVTLRLLRAVKTVGEFTSSEQNRHALLEEAANISVSAQAALSVTSDCEAVKKAYHGTLVALEPQRAHQQS